MLQEISLRLDLIANQSLSLVSFFNNGVSWVGEQPSGKCGNMDTRTDTELLVASRSDSEAFHVLYQRLADPILCYFMRRTGDIHVSAELMAETFAVALAKRHKYRPRKGVDGAAWIYGIARNELSHYFRSKDIEMRALKRLQLQTPVLSTSDIERIEALMEAERVTEDLHSAIDSLPEQDRRVVELRVLEEKEYADIGNQEGTTSGAARVRVHRALRRLSNQVGSSYES